MPSNDGGLAAALVGEKIQMNQRNLTVSRLLGEGGFSYVYLCKEIDQADGAASSSKHRGGSEKSGKQQDDRNQLVLKVTSIHSRQQRDIAEKEAKLLSRLSHPSIIKMYDTCYRTVNTAGGFLSKDQAGKPQHLILMEFCEGGHALDVCNQLASQGKRFDLSTLIIAFGQICNAVSYLHAQRPPIVHRDLKPVNFLIKNGAYKLCDFGSAVFGHVDLRTPKARADAEEVIEKTTTQMFRAPEMVDLYSSKRLTQATDVWALGCCLYSLAFLQNCFEEGSNLAILSRKYKIPEDNPYGDGLVELLDRMLTTDAKARSDMTEVILCLSAVYSGRPLPPRKKVAKSKKGCSGSGAGGSVAGESTGTAEGAGGASTKSKKKKEKTERTGTFRTDGQGIYRTDGQGVDPADQKKKAESKKLNPNSAAARRRMQAQGDKDIDFSSFHSKFSQSVVDNDKAKSADPFGQTEDFFASMPENDQRDANNKVGDAFGSDVFGSFDEAAHSKPATEGGSDDGNTNKDAFAAFDDNGAWGATTNTSSFHASFSVGDGGDVAADTEEAEASDPSLKKDDKGGSSKSGSRDRGVRRSVSESPGGPSSGRPRPTAGGRRPRRSNDENVGGREQEDHSVVSGMTETTEQTQQSRSGRHRSRGGGGGDDEKRRGGSRSHAHGSKHGDKDGSGSDRHRGGEKHRSGDKHHSSGDRHHGHQGSRGDRHGRREKDESIPRRAKSNRGIMQSS